MDRGELEDLDRESLVVRAQAAGIRRARILTRPELIDELLRLDPSADAAQLRKSRGFFGRARDLVARVVERGLHLPDAAERIRDMALGTVPSSVPRTEPQAMPTVTLAEIYAAQGHRQRAIETLRRVLEREPEHVAARALLARLEDEAYVAPPPPLPPEPEIEPELNASDEEEAEEESVTEDLDEEAADEALTVESAFARGGQPVQGPSDQNGDYEFSLAPAGEGNETAEGDPAYAPTRELPRGSGRTYAFTADRRAAGEGGDVDAHARTDRFDAVPERGRPAPVAVAPAPASPAAVLAADASEPAEECFAIPVPRDAATEGAGGRMYVRWSISWSTVGALLGARPNGRFVVRALVVTPAWDGPNTETRDLVIDPDAEQAMLVGLPEPSVVRVAVGWLDGSTFVPISHSPALEMSRGRGLVIWTTKGAVPVVLDDPRAASIARALDASRAAVQAHP